MIFSSDTLTRILKLTVWKACLQNGVGERELVWNGKCLKKKKKKELLVTHFSIKTNDQCHLKLDLTYWIIWQKVNQKLFSNISLRLSHVLKPTLFDHKILNIVFWFYHWINRFVNHTHKNTQTNYNQLMILILILWSVNSIRYSYHIIIGICM